MATFREATPAEMREIAASVDLAWRELVQKEFNKSKPKRGHRQRVRKPYFDIVANRKEIFTRLAPRKAVLRALDESDCWFFAQLGRALDAKFCFVRELQIPIPRKLDAFLISHWAEPRDKLPPLCYLKVSDLTMVLSQRLGDETLEEATVVKLRQRLKLKPFRHKLHARYDSSGNISFSDVDN